MNSKRFFSLFMMFAIVIGFTACNKTAEDINPIDASNLENAQIMTMSELQKMGDVEIQDGITIPENADIYFIDAEIDNSSKDKSQVELKYDELPGIGIPSCNYPSCSDAMASIVAQYQSLANANCQTYYFCVPCCSGNSMLYVTFAVAPTVICPVEVEIGIDEM